MSHQESADTYERDCQCLRVHVRISLSLARNVFVLLMLLLKVLYFTCLLYNITLPYTHIQTLYHFSYTHSFFLTHCLMLSRSLCLKTALQGAPHPENLYSLALMLVCPRECGHSVCVCMDGCDCVVV